MRKTFWGSAQVLNNELQSYQSKCIFLNSNHSQISCCWLYLHFFTNVPTEVYKGHRILRIQRFLSEDSTKQILLQWCTKNLNLVSDNKPPCWYKAIQKKKKRWPLRTLNPCLVFSALPQWQCLCLREVALQVVQDLYLWNHKVIELWDSLGRKKP